ncbi:hypothetical protein [Xenophilus azovorans]|nr:hypothetical protein [Xenophilus azovorans]
MSRLTITLSEPRDLVRRARKRSSLGEAGAVELAQKEVRAHLG